MLWTLFLPFGILIYILYLSLKANKKVNSFPEIKTNHRFEQLPYKKIADMESIAEEVQPNRRPDLVELVNLEAKISGGNELPAYEPALDLPGYQFPYIDLFDKCDCEKQSEDENELEIQKNLVSSCFQNLKIGIQELSAKRGPALTLIEVVLAPSVRITKVQNLAEEIVMRLPAKGSRVIAPIPGKGTIGIEIPHRNKCIVNIRRILSSEKYEKSEAVLPIGLGSTADGQSYITDLIDLKNIFIGGATGQGKSVALNTVILSLLFKKHPSQLKLVLMDFKRIQFNIYRVIEKHFFAKLPDVEEAIINDPKVALRTLKGLWIELDNRVDLLGQAGARNIIEYNDKFVQRQLDFKKGHQYLPFIVVVIDELGSFANAIGDDIKEPLGILVKMGRAMGIYFIVSSGDVSSKIFTREFMSGFSSRIAFKTVSVHDSMVILNESGADNLMSGGDFILLINNEVLRLQCAFASTEEAARVADFIGMQRGYPEAYRLPEYLHGSFLDGSNIDPNGRDPLFEEAARLVVQNQLGATTLLQRRMKLGYNRAGRLMDQLEAAGIVGPGLGSRPREVLIKSEMELAKCL